MGPHENAIAREKFTTGDKALIALFFFYCFLIDMATVYALFPITWKICSNAWLPVGVLLAFFAAFQAIKRGSVRINKGIFVILFLYVLGAVIRSLHIDTQSFGFFMPRLYIVYALFLFYRGEYLQTLIDIATVLFLVMVVFAIIGFLYAFMGYPSLMWGEAPWGTGYRWYLTTGATERGGGIIGNIIRPTGIYDEPGGFSFFVCGLSILRVLAKRNNTVTFILLLLANITFSMIHIVVFALFILHLLVKYRMKKVLALYIVLVAGVSYAAYIPLKEPIDDLLFARFIIDERTGQMQGDSRTGHLLGGIEQIKKRPSSLIWGVPFEERQSREMVGGETPLEPMLKDGIFVGWIYYAFMLYFVLCGVADRKNLFMYLSIIAIYAQRPMLYSPSYVAMLLILGLTAHSVVKKRAKNNFSLALSSGV